MYTNLPSQWAFEVAVAATQTIADGATGKIAFSVPGVKYATDLAYAGVLVRDDTILALVDAGGLTIYNDNTLGLTLTNHTGSTLTVTAGDKVRGIIAHCDNSFHVDGL